MAMKPKWMIVYEALAVGQEIRFPNHQYPYALDTEGRICYVFGEDGMGLVCDITLNSFVKLCESLALDEVFILGAQTTLTKMNNKKALSRTKTGDRDGSNKSIQELPPASTGS